MKEPYVKLGIDQLFDAVVPDEINLGEPPKYFDQKQIRYVEFLTKNGFPIIPLYIGPIGQKVIDGMIGAIKAYAEAGNNIVVDYIQYDTFWTPKLKEALKQHKVYWIGVKIPLEVLEQREKERGTSPIGHARAHYDDIHKNMTYDLAVDTSKMSAKDCAIKIKTFVEK